jgi:hypothetical protein
MTDLRHYVDQMRLRLTEIATGELALVRALGDALSQVDQKLLWEVRQVTAAHEARRGAILGELQSLASNIGAFPAAEPVAQLEKEEEPRAREALSTLRPGDWRQAAKNIEADLDFVLEAGVNGHSNGNGNGHAGAYRHVWSGRDIRFDYS